MKGYNESLKYDNDLVNVRKLVSSIEQLSVGFNYCHII